jgi:hypothetical protein
MITADLLTSALQTLEDDENKLCCVKSKGSWTFCSSTQSLGPPLTCILGSTLLKPNTVQVAWICRRFDPVVVDIFVVA